MRARLQQWIYRIQGSYWFVPTLMAITAIVLSQVTVQLDRMVGADWMTDSWWASLNQPDGARALLATVAGSMITVTGVTFSLTILAVSYATSHFGPRLLDNFMRDRGNQVTLGTFVATFLYCLLVLRTVRSGSTDEANLQTNVFVPHISVLLAIGLTLASVGVLIYFIHHIPESIHISNVLDQIARQLSVKIAELYPESLGEAVDQVPRDLLETLDEGLTVSAKCSGYLQGVDDTSLLDFTEKHDAIAQLHVRPGEYLLQGQPIATIHPSSGEALDCDECSSHVLGSLAIGISRTPTQDILFLINQFVEIAARALSPGVNDPFTAIQCIDQLSKALIELSARSIPSRFRKDEAGNLRLITTEQTWKGLIDGAFGQLVPYVKADPNVTEHMVKRIVQIREVSKNGELNRQLVEVCELLTSPDATR